MKEIIFTLFLGCILAALAAWSGIADRAGRLIDIDNGDYKSHYLPAHNITKGGVK